MRSVRVGLPLLLLFALLAGCGFHLRGEIPGTRAEKTLLVSGISTGNPFYKDLVDKLTIAGGYLAASPKQASANIHINKARHVRRPITLNSVGKANMFDLDFIVIFEVFDPKGKTILPEKEVVIRREYYNTQTVPLAQGYEEQTIRAEMQVEAAAVVLRQALIRIEEYRKSQVPEPKSGEAATPPAENPVTEAKNPNTAAAASPSP